jgi:hypothetical protein
MKKPLMLIFLFFIIAAGGAHADHGSFVIAQTESQAATTAPAPVVQPAAVPATPAPSAEPVTAPTGTAAPAWKQGAPAEGPSGVSTKGFMAQQLSHKDFATMDLKECAKCHKGSGIAPTHGTDQVREHGFLARRAGKNCVDCHDQQFCLDCHRGGGIDANLNISNYRMNYIPTTHRTDFREIHPIKALDTPQTCTKCHDTKFCSECHAKFRGEDLMVLSHRRAWSDSRPSALSGTHGSFPPSSCQTCHPGGLLPQHVWSSDHAREARRNLQACQTCHSDGQVCMTCHSARTGLMINPHPSGWDKVKDGYKKKSNGRSCTKCHDKY